jgi:hypothetical protein
LAIPLAYEIGVGNVNAFLLLGMILVWRLVVAGRDTAAGALVGAMAAIKLAPIVLAWWLLVRRSWRGLGGVLAGALCGLLTGIAGAGVSPHVEYLSIARTTLAIGTSDLSLAGIGRAVGLPSALAAVLPTVWLVVGLVLVAAVRHRPGLAFGLSVATVVLASPVVNINSYAMLLAALAPAAWPVPEARAARATERPVPVEAGW